MKATVLFFPSMKPSDVSLNLRAESLVAWLRPNRKLETAGAGRMAFDGPPDPALLPEMARRFLIERRCYKLRCPGRAVEHGLCSTHHVELVAALQTSKPSVPCHGPECSRPPTSKGLCSAHYQQSRAGRPLAPIRAKVAAPKSKIPKAPRIKSVRLSVSVPWAVAVQLGPDPESRLLDLISQVTTSVTLD
jgi:hypothetical protein